MDPVGAVVHAIESGVSFLQHTQGGFGVLLIPLAVLGFISYLATRK